MVPVRYADRETVGKRLADDLHYLGPRSDIVVFGIPKGGMVVANVIARDLSAPLDLFMVRKIRVPNRPELAMGAVATGGEAQLNEEVVNHLGIIDSDIGRVEEEELRELYAHERRIRGNKARLDPRGSVAVVVVDGMATGATMHVALREIQKKHPAELVAVSPVGTPATVREIRHLADRVICPLQPTHLGSVASWYDHYPEVDDEYISRILQENRAPAMAGG